MCSEHEVDAEPLRRLLIRPDSIAGRGGDKKRARRSVSLSTAQKPPPAPQPPHVPLPPVAAKTLLKTKLAPVGLLT